MPESIRGKLIILFIFFSFESILSKPKIWLEKSPGPFSSTFIYHESGKSVIVGIFGHSDINKLVQDNPAALKLAKTSNSYATAFAIWSTVSIVFLIGAVVPLFSFSRESEPTQRDFVLGRISIVSAIGGLITAFVAGSTQQTSRFYLLRTIKTYNVVYHREKAFMENRSVLLSLRLGSHFF